LGLVVTVLVGYVSLRLLLRIVMKGRLYLFAFYCWAVGFAVLLAQFLSL
jgi:undecaprenyl-diphosphatase